MQPVVKALKKQQKNEKPESFWYKCNNVANEITDFNWNPGL